MRVVRTGKAGAENRWRHRNMVQRQLLLQLVERALKREVASTGLPPAGDTCRERRSMFLSDAGVDIVRTARSRESRATRVSRGGDRNRFVRKPRFEQFIAMAP